MSKAGHETLWRGEAYENEEAWTTTESKWTLKGYVWTLYKYMVLCCTRPFRTISSYFVASFSSRGTATFVFLSWSSMLRFALSGKTLFHFDRTKWMICIRKTDKNRLKSSCHSSIHLFDSPPLASIWHITLVLLELRKERREWQGTPSLDE